MARRESIEAQPKPANLLKPQREMKQLPAHVHWSAADAGELISLQVRRRKPAAERQINSFEAGDRHLGPVSFGADFMGAHL
jgi:hypothetical protein